ncbi:MAG: hypothetical protein M0Z54_07015 [Thermaerobacter sp.]|nr:hypothetical protein [Thermaerobacter sp.]
MGAPGAAAPLDVAQGAPWLAAELDQVLDRARDEARAILEQADTEAAAVRSLAERQGYLAGVEAGRAEWQRAIGRLQEEFEAPRSRLAALSDTTRLLEDQVVLATAAALAEQVVGEALRDAPRLWARARALAAAVAGERVAMYCAPEVFDQLADSLAKLDDGSRVLTLARDATLGPADLWVEAESGGGVDGRVLASLRHILEEVHEGHGDHPNPA